MTETSPDQPTTGIDDELLPEDLQPGDDNPLAEGLEPGETVGDLLADGKPAAETPPEESGAQSDAADGAGGSPTT